MFRYLLPAVFLLFTVTVCWSLQAEEKPLLPELKEIEVSGPYCGIYSLLAILDTFDKHPDISTLLVPEYVGSYKGSSNEELVKAADANELYAKTYGGLTWHELKAAKTPMILHFRSSFADEKYNHWVAYLGVDGKHARIIDLPHPLTTITFAELMAKWDGTAIVISDKPIDSHFTWTSRIHYFSMVGILFAVVFLIQYFVGDKNKEAFFAPTYLLRLKRGILQTALLLGSIFIVAVLYHAVSETGFLKNPSAVAEVTRRYYSVDVPEISLNEMKSIVNEKSMPIFDARFSRDFNLGSIPGAKNMAIDSSLTERQQLLNDIEKNRRIIVFCQSSGCGYSDEVAQFLKFNGYSNVVLYRGGYREWKDKTVTPSQEDQP